MFSPSSSQNFRFVFAVCPLKIRKPAKPCSPATTADAVPAYVRFVRTISHNIIYTVTLGRLIAIWFIHSIHCFFFFFYYFVLLPNPPAGTTWTSVQRIYVRLYTRVYRVHSHAHTRTVQWNAFTSCLLTIGAKRVIRIVTVKLVETG